MLSSLPPQGTWRLYSRTSLVKVRLRLRCQVCRIVCQAALTCVNEEGPRPLPSWMLSEGLSARWINTLGKVSHCFSLTQVKTEVMDHGKSPVLSWVTELISCGCLWRPMPSIFFFERRSSNSSLLSSGKCRELFWIEYGPVCVLCLQLYPRT